MNIPPKRPHRISTAPRLTDLIVAIKGAGEMASGVAICLYQSNIRKIVMLEIDKPLAVRRTVSFCESIFNGRCEIEGIAAVITRDESDISAAWDNGAIAVVQDPKWDSLPRVLPDVVVDATLAKTNLGTTMDDAPLVIGLGPGFDAGTDVHLVIETLRGHDIGRIIESGPAHPNTGVPGAIGGHTSRRVLRAPCDGLLETPLEIGAMVTENQPIGRVGDQTIPATLSGVLRGLIRPGTNVTKGLKIGDIDPRGIIDYCYSISDKARALGGGVLRAILSKCNLTSEGGASSLAGAIGLSGRGVISLIGAGGKTSLMFALAKELAAVGRSVLTTTTTKIFFPSTEQSSHTVVEASCDRLLSELTAVKETAPHLAAGKKVDRRSGKLIGIPPETVDRIWQAGVFDVILIEADGSKRHPLKASADYEPVTPLSTSHLVHVTGLEAIGMPVESAVFRPEIFRKNLSLESGTLLTESHLADAIVWEVRKADKQCRPLITTVVLNKADTLQQEHQGRRIGDRLQGQPNIHQVAVLELNADHPVKHCSLIM